MKQADLVMAMLVRGEAFSAEQKARNFAYYEPLTVRDSSLSACVQAVLAAETGHLELAYDYLGEAALMDLDDLEHNSSDGLHIASLAGTWIAAVCGFGGLRDMDGMLSFSPRLPERLDRISFRLGFRGSRLMVEVTGDGDRLHADRRRPGPLPPLRRRGRAGRGRPQLRPRRPAANRRPGRSPSRRTAPPSAAAPPADQPPPFVAHRATKGRSARAARRILRR